MDLENAAETCVMCLYLPIHMFDICADKVIVEVLNLLVPRKNGYLTLHTTS